MLSLLSCMILALSVETKVEDMIGGKAEVTKCSIEYTDSEAWLQVEANMAIGGGNATVLFTNFAQSKCETVSAGFVVLKVDNKMLERFFLLYKEEILGSQKTIGNDVFADMQNEDAAWKSHCSYL